MIGVVVWSDPDQTKAIVWCEDHGDLAYISGHSNQAAALPLGLDEGDLIQFDLAEHNTMRLAQNARRITRQYCSGLEHVVAKVGEVASEIETSRKAREAGRETSASTIVAFPSDRASTRAALNNQSNGLPVCIAAARLSRQQ